MTTHEIIHYDLNWIVEEYGEKAVYHGPNLSPIDTHPSVQGNKIIAEVIIKKLIDLKII